MTDDREPLQDDEPRDAMRPDEVLPDEAVILLTSIGLIDEGIEGRDEYVLLTRKDDDLTPEQAAAYMLPKVYRSSSHPGAYFCTSVRAMQVQFRRNAVVCIIEHRYDI